MSKGSVPNPGREFILLAAASACVIAPFWIVQYPPLQDYWNHLLKARVLADYSNPALGYSRYYWITLLPVPNAIANLLMAGLMKLFEPMIAGKVFLSAYALAMGFSGRYLARSAGAQCRPLEYIGFAMVYNPCLWAGYVDFCLSVAFAQLAIGYWLRTTGDSRLATASKFAGLVLLTYFAHFWGLAITLVATLALAARDTRTRKLVWLTSALIAGVLLMVYSRGTSDRMLFHHQGLTYTLSVVRNSLSLPRLAGLPAGAWHFTMAGLLVAIRLALFLTILALALRHRTRVLWAVAALVVVYFVVPTQFGKMRDSGQRTLVFVPALLAASVAVVPGRRGTRVLAALVTAAIIAPTFAAAVVWRAKDRDLCAYAQALDRVPARSKLFDVVTLTWQPLHGPSKLLGSDPYVAELWFAANHALNKGGSYLHTFTTGIVQARERTPPLRPWFIFDADFDWRIWLASNERAVRRNYDYVVIVGPEDQVMPFLRRRYSERWRGRGVLLLHRKA